MLEIQDVEKMYTYATGVKTISFFCRTGEVVALIGPNGVGKSTILRIIAGIQKADAGKVMLNGVDTSIFNTRKKIGYMTEKINVGKKINAKELLYLISDYKFNGQYKDYINQAIEDYGLYKQCSKQFCDLSMGNKKKVSIIIAFMGKPELIILDEPTNGMDTAGMICMKRYIMKAKKDGASIIISSHILDFVDSIADKKVFLKNGRIEKIIEGREDLEQIYTELYLEEMG